MLREILSKPNLVVHFGPLKKKVLDDCMLQGANSGSLIQEENQFVQVMNDGVRLGAYFVFRQACAIYPASPIAEAFSLCGVPEVRRNESDATGGQFQMLWGKRIRLWAGLVDFRSVHADQVRRGSPRPAFSTAARSMASEPFDKTTSLYRDSLDNAGFTS